MGNFIPHLFHHTELLRAMLIEDALFQWDEIANSRFQHIEKLLAKTMAQPLGYYDQSKKVTVQADASQRGQ